LKLLAKQAVFSILRGKNKFYHLWPLLGKNFEKIPYCPSLEKVLPTPMIASVFFNASVTNLLKKGLFHVL